MSAAGATAATGIGALCGLIVIVFIYYLAKPKILKRVSSDKKVENYESNKQLIKELLLTAFPIILGSAIFSFTNLIDQVMVKNILIDSGFMKEEAQKLYGQLTGKYYVLVTLPVSISTALATAAIPVIAASVSKKDFETCNRQINTALRMTMLVSIPAAMGIGVLGGPILTMLLPGEGSQLLNMVQLA